VPPGNLTAWRRENVERADGPAAPGDDARTHYYKGFRIRRAPDGYLASLLIEQADGGAGSAPRLLAGSVREARKRIDRALPATLSATLLAGRLYVCGRLLLGYTLWRALRRLLGKNGTGAGAGGHPRPQGTAAALSWFHARMKERLLQFRQEVEWLADSLADIVSSLFFLERVRPGCLDAGTPVLLIESHRFAPYLRLLAALRIIPRVRLEWIRSSTQLGAFLAVAETRVTRGAAFIARSIYVRYYPLFGGADPAREMTIL
jgi:hypothetical protein